MSLFRQVTPDTLAVTRRGRPPPAPPGYVQDPGDKYLYILKIPDCEDRKVTVAVRSCGCEKTVVWCGVLNIPTTRWGCKNKCPKIK